MILLGCSGQSRSTKVHQQLLRGLAAASLPRTLCTGRVLPCTCGRSFAMGQSHAIFFLFQHLEHNTVMRTLLSSARWEATEAAWRGKNGSRGGSAANNGRERMVEIEVKVSRSHKPSNCYKKRTETESFMVINVCALNFCSFLYPFAS